MSRSTDPKMNSALEADAAKLAAMGQHSGLTMEDAPGPWPTPDSPDDYPYDDDDGLDEDGNFPFECAAYWVSGRRKTKGYWHCPLAGSEECDWECPGHPAEAPR